jgi:Uma2 family endonuclease
MAERAEPQRHLSVEEYLAFEETASVKHEYVGGVVHAQAGASDRHNRIAGKIYRRLAEAADGSPCRVYMSDMRLFTADNVFYYPDVMVCCEPPKTDNPTYRHDPCLVVEVLSPGTASIDRREKLFRYCEVPTLRDYLIVGQDEAHIEHHFREESGEWWRTEYVPGKDGGDAEISVTCPPGASLSLADVYGGL